MTIHGSKKSPFLFQDIKKMFPDKEFIYRKESDHGLITCSEVVQMNGEGHVLVSVEERRSEYWKVAVSSIPEEEVAKLPQRVIVLHAN